MEREGGIQRFYRTSYFKMRKTEEKSSDEKDHNFRFSSIGHEVSVRQTTHKSSLIWDMGFSVDTYG